MADVLRCGAHGRRVALNPTRRRRPDRPSQLAMVMNSARLRSTRDIRRVFDAGCVAHGRGMVVHARDRGDDEPSRWTAVAGRKVGGAVDRNRAKRRLRAIVVESPLPVGRDMVVIARRAALSEPFTELREEFGSLMGRFSCGATEPGGAR